MTEFDTGAKRDTGGKGRCEGCVCKRKCNDGDVDECWQRTEIRELARELGIEVDE